MQDNDRNDKGNDRRDRQYHDDRRTGSATDSGAGAGSVGTSIGGVTDGGAGGVGGAVADGRGNMGDMGDMGRTTINGSPGMAGGIYTGGEVFSDGDVNDTIGTMHGADAGIGEAVGGISGPEGGRSPGITDQDTITPVSTSDTETSRSDQAPGGTAATRPKAA